jgi:putative heme-binding domain-containing protein
MSCLFKVHIAYFICLPITFTSSQLSAETLRQPIPFVEQLQSTGAADLAHQARQRGNAHRGGLVFYKSGAACVNCHLQTPEGSPLGPKLAELGEVTDTHVIDSLLYPSKSIRKGYETQSVLTTSGEIIVGMVAKEDNDSITLRSVSDLNQDRVIPKKEIEAVKPNAKSMMPEGLVASIGNLRDFLDLACYLMEIAEGGSARAKELMPSPEELQFKDDTLDLDHAGIISTLRSRDFETGKGIYHGYCFNCHGNDGNTPSLPTARAFGNQKMRFGSDPFRMFMTLSHGKGLMAAMRHLTPKERSRTIHEAVQSGLLRSGQGLSRIIAHWHAKWFRATQHHPRIRSCLGLATGASVQQCSECESWKNHDCLQSALHGSGWYLARWSRPE